LEHSAEVGQQGRIRIARRQISQSVSNLRSGRKHHRRSIGDECSHAAEARPPSRNEDKGTLVVAVPIEEFSAKIRGNEVSDEPEDYDLPIWAGAIPRSTLVGAAEPDPRLADGVDIPKWVRRFVVGR
jgi:hypothetical protein